MALQPPSVRRGQGASGLARSVLPNPAATQLQDSVPKKTKARAVFTGWPAKTIGIELQY